VLRNRCFSLKSLIVSGSLFDGNVEVLKTLDERIGG